MKRALYVLALASCLVGCKGSGATVEIDSASPTTLTLPSATDLTLHVKYVDPDGDLGGGVAEIVDCRADGLVTRLPIPAIATEEAVNAHVRIEGTLDLVVARVGPAPMGPMAARCKALGVTGAPGDPLPFCVVLTDAGGDATPGACSAPITIVASP